MGLYYLQSRYYSPEVGRFLNADVYISTGQGVLGNNMFTYCSNNPANRIDTTGSKDIWIYLIMYSDMGFIHRAVTDHIKSNYAGIKTEHYLDTWGRADVVNLATKEVWEIKHAGKDPALRAASATLQAYGYTLINEDVSYLGRPNAFSGTFYIGCEGLSYEVSYDTTHAGVILYYVKEVSNYSGAYFKVFAYEEKKSEHKETEMLLLCPYMICGVGGGGVPLEWGSKNSRRVMISWC